MVQQTTAFDAAVVGALGLIVALLAALLVTTWGNHGD